VSGLIADRLGFSHAWPLAIPGDRDPPRALALFLGVMAAAYRDRAIDRAVRGFAPARHCRAGFSGSACC